jgi:hypothetical protein
MIQGLILCSCPRPLRFLPGFETSAFQYVGDVGLFCLFLFNITRLQPGQVGLSHCLCCCCTDLSSSTASNLFRLSVTNRQCFWDPTSPMPIFPGTQWNACHAVTMLYVLSPVSGSILFKAAFASVVQRVLLRLFCVGSRWVD